MLPRKFRLTFIQFQQNSQSFRKFSLQALSLQIKKSQSLSVRFVIIVPKSLDKRSFYRHQTKRMIIEAIRLVLPKIKGGFDLLIRPKKILSKKEKVEIQNEINVLFKKTGLL